MTRDAPVRAVARRIVVALDSFRGSSTVLELAVTLAARQQAELEAVFVEDLNLLHVASLPFVREIDLVSASIRPFGESDLQRALRLQAQRVERELQRMARASQVAWRMRVARGRLLETALAAGEVDIVLLARPSEGCVDFGLAGESAQRPAGAWARQRICVLYDGSEAARRALALADLIAAEQDMSVAVGVMQEQAHPASELDARVAPSPRAPRELRMVSPGAPLPSALACGLLLVPSKVGAVGARAWLTAIRCPVLFVS